MRKVITDEGIEQEFDDEGLCRYVRVPRFMMDVAPKPPANSYEGYVADYAATLRRYGEIGAAAGGSTPGVVRLSDADRRARADAAEERSRALADSWRGEQDPGRAPTEEARKSHAEWLQNAWRQR